ncbi:MAG TPA: sigma-70 family RNA polymerase sigma factor [Arenicellales bacterium]|nr:sigma-70 family RNA polymerase sigma factor [Arenicellales bacterium]
MQRADADHQARRLLAAVADGDKSSMEEFYEMFERDVYAFARSRLDDPHAAADILHEVMLAVWRTAGRFQGGSRVRTWLLGIANNKVLDALRRRGRRAHEELDDGMPDEAAEAGERAVAAAQHSRSVLRCLESLNDRHRQVVHLAFFEDLSYGEIAQVVDCPPGTVKTRMYHARNLLKRCLERMGVNGALVQ